MLVMLNCIESSLIDHICPLTFQAGGVAGTAVDVALFPLDTLKTRLQSEAGFRASGGFRGIYSGLGPAALASAPNGWFLYCMFSNDPSHIGIENVT